MSEVRLQVKNLCKSFGITKAEQLLDKVGSMRPQMEKILNAVDKINEGD